MFFDFRFNGPVNPVVVMLDHLSRERKSGKDWIDNSEKNDKNFLWV